MSLCSIRHTFPLCLPFFHLSISSPHNFIVFLFGVWTTNKLLHIVPLHQRPSNLCLVIKNYTLRQSNFRLKSFSFLTDSLPFLHSTFFIQFSSSFCPSFASPWFHFPKLYNKINCSSLGYCLTNAIILLLLSRSGS